MLKLRACAKRVTASLQRISNGSVGRLATRYPDLVVIPWFLAGAELYTYFVARIFSLGIPIALHILSSRLGSNLRILSDNGDGTKLQAAAARINLGYLMVCGSMALIVLEGAPYLDGVFDLSFSDPGILVWLVVGQSAPVLFGATSLLMHVAERKLVHEMLLALTASLFIFSMLFLGADSGLVIAQSLAAAQITHAAICAVILTRWGIWPGLTALFHKEIKLF